jgi:protein TonB
MRVLVVDQDSASNEAIARSLRELYTVDAVTNKGDCLDLLRSNTFEVIVATERLEDGSGLELLGTVAKKWPSVLRIFAADRRRLQLLKGRLGPFELFQTLTYPIDPDRLIATLSLAGAAQDANADTSNIQHVVLSGEPPPEALEEAEQAAESDGSGEFPAPQPVPRAASMEHSEPAQRITRSAVRGGPSHRVRSIAGQRPRGNGAAGPPTTRVAAGPSAVRGAAPSPSLTSEGSRHKRARTNRLPPVRFPPLERSPPLEPPQGSSAGRSGAPQTDSFAEAAAMARAARSNFESPPEEFDTKRLAIMVGGGAAVVVAVLVIGFKLFGSKSEAPRPAAPPVAQAPQYSQEVGDLVAQTEAALKADDFKSARATVDKLRQIAPSHPRLAFFDGLLTQRGDASKASGAAAAGGHGTSKGGGQSSRRRESKPDEKADVTAATAPSTTSSPTSTSPTAAASNLTSRPSAAAGRTASPSIAAGQPGANTNSTSLASARSASGGDSAPTGAASDSSAPQTPGLAPETPPGLTRPSAQTAPARDGDALASSSTANAASATGRGLATTGAMRVAADPAAAATASAAAVGGSTPAAPSADDAPPAPTHVASTSATRRASSGEPPPVVREAKLIHRVAPDYPSAAKRDGIAGSVDLEVTISSSGVVEDVSVVSATPLDMFEKSAVAAVRKWKYDPRFVDGLPTEARVKVHLDFGPGK